MTSVLIQKHVLINGKWVERPYVLTRDGNGWHDTPADLTLDRYQERASQQAADRVRLKDRTDEGWRTAEARAIDALIADADEAGRKLDASLDGLKGKSLDEMLRDEMKRIA